MDNKMEKKPRDYFKTKLNNLKNKIKDKKQEIQDNIMQHNALFLNSNIKEVMSVSEKADLILQKNPSVKIVVEDSEFQIGIDKLNFEQDSIFYKIVNSSKYKEGMELFFDRPKLYFEILLKWFRYKYLDLAKLNYAELCLLLRESEYYGMTNLSNEIKTLMAPLKVVDIKITSEITLSDNKKYGLPDSSVFSKKTCSVYSSKEIEIELNYCWPKLLMRLTPAYSLFNNDKNKELKNCNENMKIFISSNKSLWIEQQSLTSLSVTNERTFDKVRFIKLVSANNKPIGFSNIEFIKKI